jgi:hypothetical protein
VVHVVVLAATEAEVTHRQGTAAASSAPPRLQLALLDAQVAFKLWVVAANLLDEALCVLAGARTLKAEIAPRLGGRRGNLSVDPRKTCPPQGYAGVRADPPAPRLT